MNERCCMEEMSFCGALGIRRGATAIIGGGGKTSLMLQLAGELCAAGSVIICTSTHIWRPEGIAVLESAKKEEIAAALVRYGTVCIGEAEGEKLTAPGLPIEQLTDIADYVVVEADGSKGLPLKAHNASEPVIPQGAGVIYVVGADGIGKPIAEAAHRPELYAAALGVDVSHTVTPKDAAAMVDYGSTVLFNKAESQADIENGRAFAAAFCGRTVIASLRQGRVVEVIG